MKREVTHFTLTAQVDGFPAVIIVRAEPMPWRAVLKAAKQICKDNNSGKNVLWHDINVFESPWATIAEGEAQWADWTNRHIMYEIKADGSYKSVGKDKQ